MNLINRHKELFIASFVVFCIIFYCLIYTVDSTIVFGLLGVVLSFYFGSIKQTADNDKLFKELFQEFNSRYDKTFNDLINELRKDTSRELNRADENLVIDYFNLCAEEYLWRSKNRIPKKVWVAWKAGILGNLEIIQIKKLYEEQIKIKWVKESYYGLVEELDFQTL
ncbi:MAG: hypothetical protein ACI8ZO_001120 [Flavobacteriales bacterium]|jgi:hypothetical protein